MGAFVISKRFNDEYKFVFTSRKGKTIFTSLGYELKFECEEAIENLKNTIEVIVFTKFKSSGDKHYFKIIYQHQFIATSRKYTTVLRMQKGIDEIIKYASRAEILDFSENNFVFSDIEETSNK